MRVVIVEDDYLQADWIKNLLLSRLGVADGDVELIATECEFRDRLENFRAHPPSLFVIDVMLRWADATADYRPSPPDVKEEGFFRAGLRCERLLRQARETKRIPVVLYTVLEESELEPGLKSVGTATKYIGKSSADADLVAHINELAARR